MERTVQWATGSVKFCDITKNNFGDHKKIDSEISELRLNFGSGYRIYYTEIDNIVVLLINGGNKSTQSKKQKVYFKNGETYNERIKTYARLRKLYS